MKWCGRAVRVGAADPVGADEVFVADLLADLRLEPEAGERLLVGDELGVKDLDRHERTGGARRAGRRGLGAIHSAHPAAPQLCADAVDTQAFSLEAQGGMIPRRLRAASIDAERRGTVERGGAVVR